MSSSIELTSGPADTGSPDTGSPDAGGGPPEDVGVDAAIYVECEEPSDCVLIAECCDECGPQYDDVLSVPRDGRDGPEPAQPPECDTLDCTFCAEYYPEPMLIPDCVENLCTIIDLAELGELNECGRNEACLLRGSACCECGLDPDYDTLVSITESSEGDYVEHVCGGMSCPACREPDYGDFVAFCDELEDGVGRCSFYGADDE